MTRTAMTKMEIVDVDLRKSEDGAEGFELIVAFNDEPVRVGYRISNNAAEKIFALSEAEPAHTVRKLTNLEKEITLLHIIDAMGGVTDSSDYPGNWITWFCSDEIHNVQDDTFNRCHEKGLLRTGHDSDTDTSTTYMTSAGKSALTQAAEPAPEAPPTSDVDALRAEIAAIKTIAAQAHRHRSNQGKEAMFLAIIEERAHALLSKEASK